LQILAEDCPVVKIEVQVYEEFATCVSKWRTFLDETGAAKASLKQMPGLSEKLPQIVQDCICLRINACCIFGVLGHAEAI
jgi:hypothetical protein